MAKRLLFFFDGTANSAAEGNWSDTTNVFRLNVAFHHEGNQIVFYMPGVGTRGDVLSRATGRGLDHIIREAYVNLSSNYQPGDELYLFGFSRGAAAARALTGLVCKAGLLYPHELDHLNGLWHFFTGDERTPSIEMRQLRRDHIEGRVWARGEQPVFNFVGAFDTVAGKSWDRLNLFTKVRFANLRLDPQVRVGVHLLAIDDTRNPSYSPLLWTIRTEPTQKIEQIWMPGVHADIGGNSNGLLLGDVALLTMMDRVSFYCPQLIWDTGYIDYLKDGLRSHARVEISDERFDWKRKLLRFKRREIGQRNSNEEAVHCNESVHAIADYLIGKEIRVRTTKATYAVPNLPSHFPRFSTGYDELFKEACELTLARMR